MENAVVSSEPWVAKWGKGERLDGGGQGDTFLVPDRVNPQGVMKLLKSTRATDGKSRRRMFQEVSNLKILHNAGALVPQVLDDNTSEFENVNVPLFFVMERIEGQTLAQLISEKKQLNLATAIGLTLVLCRTFGIAFRERISHRDIKPENLIVTSLEPPKIVVVDFGLSFNEEKAQHLTDVDEAFDNKFISLPERRGPGENKRDPRSDIAGICAVFFFCLTGCAPRNLRDSKNRPPHRWEGFSMSTIGPTPSHVSALNALFDRGFNYELQSRFQTLEEFEERIKELLSEGPSPPLEDLSAIAHRESAILRETDRKTLLAELRAGTRSISETISKQIRSVGQKLNGTLFGFTRTGRQPAYEGEYGEQIFESAIDLQVRNHEMRVGIQYLAACKENECVVLRRVYDIFGAQYLNIETKVVMRYDARSGKPDPELVAGDFERVVAVAIPRLRNLTQS